ncbi:MAG: putative selenium-dependent hydroxylase accessory protein YqeC [Spirochaetaceae bacterium]|jgi:probable selenium-dependent hydroxylase accessory protein YqeC|nr:putative selenium-dependent hydroxylase accessory protein YqeC [Spirochaetaceae bacterium]
MRLADFFKFLKTSDRQIVSIIGCGGKTSLLWALAAQARRGKILVTTTTHTQRPEQADGLYDYFFDEAASTGLKPADGVGLAGNVNSSGFSISSFSIPALERIIPLFDNVFIEADGSRAKPLKAWADYEPVITDSTTVSVGILPLWPLGRPVSQEIVHRLPLFTALSGAGEGSIISLEHYLPVISGRTPDGIDMDAALSGSAHSLFKISCGKKVLFFNQVEDEEQMENARRLEAMLPPDFRAGLSAVIAGSVRQDRMELL